MRELIKRNMEEVLVCCKTLLAVHGITKEKVEYLVSNLRSTRISPLDKRSKNDNRHWRLPEENRNAIKDRISSFKGSGSHYGNQTKKKPMCLKN